MSTSSFLLAGLLAATFLPTAERETKIAVGVNQRLEPIYCRLDHGDRFQHLPAEDKRRILIIGGLDGSADSEQLALATWNHFSGRAEQNKQLEIAVIALPPGSEDALSEGYPPKAESYFTDQRSVATYLWRWIGVFAPDLVVDVRSGNQRILEIPSQELCQPLRKQFPDSRPPASDSDLIEALAGQRPGNVGSVPAMRIYASSEQLLPWLEKTLNTLTDKGGLPKSPARVEMQSRLERTPLQTAEQLAQVYGHDLSSVSYIPALAIMGRMQLADFTKADDVLTDAERITAPYATGTQSSLGDKPNGSVIAGHLVFAELAERTGNPAYLKLARLAADQAFDESGNMREAMPYHSEMSDAVFMGSPILARVGKLTGESKYFDMCARNFEFIKKLTMRSDHIYRHSPLDEAAWGRGNGFPALGLALTLSDLPEDHPAYASILRDYRDHMAAMAKVQDFTGHWRQVVDHSGSYRELTSTCMITFAMARGIRRGWLDPKYREHVERGWAAISGRVASDGGLIDVCTGTGKQKSLRDYFNRTAILGKDDRGGAMALQAALEVHRLHQD